VALLRGCTVGVCTVVGFPLGANTTAVKVREAEKACDDGASELDMVMNVGRFLAGDQTGVATDIEAVVRAASGQALVKVILETGLLTDDQKVAACQLVAATGAAFVKTSTGFGPGGATVHDVALMRSTVGSSIGVKASGGIRTAEQALSLLDAGASRLGTSVGEKLLDELRRASP
jgi:deoxyribose-phosphate aldolase